MVVLQWVMFVVSVTLQVCVIAAMRRSAYKKRHTFVYTYSIFLLLKILVDAAIFAGIIPASKPAKTLYYYRSDAVREFFLLAVVVSLIEGTVADSALRTRIRFALASAAVVAAFTSLVVHWNPSRLVVWMTQVTRDLSFGSVALTLLLWLKLISSPKKDRLTLMVTVGLGLQFTGEAIGQSLRQLGHFHHSAGPELAGNLLLSTSHLMRLYVWWEAFRIPARGLDKKEEPGGELETFPRQAETLYQSNA